MVRSRRPKFRQMIHAGETSIPKPIFLDSAESFSIPSRDSNRSIPCRVLKPTDDSVKGVYMHLHPGSWTLGDETSQDPMLQRIANSTSLLCISIGYRLVPEEPFPAGLDDCIDVASWLATYSRSIFGADLSFIGGESAGAHLSVLTPIHLRRSAQHANFQLKRLLLHFGVYDLSGLPQFHNFAPSTRCFSLSTPSRPRSLRSVPVCPHRNSRIPRSRHYTSDCQV
jgi:acetyl esterase/lipase